MVVTLTGMREGDGGTLLWALVEEWLRSTPGANQTVLARGLGVTRAAVSRWAVGGAAPSAAHVGGLARMIGVSYATLLTASMVDRGYLSAGERLTADEVGAGPGEPWTAASGEQPRVWRLFEEWAAAHTVRPGVAQMAQRVGVGEKVLGKWRTQRVWTSAENLRGVAAGLEVPYRRALLAMLADNGFCSMPGERVVSEPEGGRAGEAAVWGLIESYRASFRYPPSMEALASELGVSAADLDRWRGGEMPTAQQVRAVAAVTGRTYRHVLAAALVDGGYLSPGEGL